MVWRYCDAGDCFCVGIEVCNKRGLQSTCSAISWHETVTRGVPATDWTFVYPRAKVVLKVTVVVEVEVFEQITDTRLLSV